MVHMVRIVDHFQADGCDLGHIPSGRGMALPYPRQCSSGMAANRDGSPT
jgi:hypothetical protein